MILWKEVTANLASGTPTIASIQFDLPKGVITKLDVTIPLGHVGLTETRIFYQAYQVFPLVSGAFRGDASYISFHPNLVLDDPPREMIIQVTNRDDTFNHTVYVMIEIDTKLALGVTLSELLQLG